MRAVNGLGGNRVRPIALGVAICAASLALATVALGADPAPPAARAIAAQPQAMPEDYVIGPLDKLSIKVFKVAELSSDGMQVDAAGDVQMPLIGAVHASGKTATALAKDIADKLGQSYLQNPQVTVFVEDSASRKVTVEGSVKQAGVFTMKGQITLMQAIAMAGGLDDVANVHHVALIRQVDGQRHVAMYDFSAIRAAKVADPIIKGEDVIVVDSSGSKIAFKELLQSAPLLSVLFLH